MSLTNNSATFKTRSVFTQLNVTLSNLQGKHDPVMYKAFHEFQWAFVGKLTVIIYAATMSPVVSPISTFCNYLRIWCTTQMQNKLQKTKASGQTFLKGVWRQPWGHKTATHWSSWEIWGTLYKLPQWGPDSRAKHQMHFMHFELENRITWWWRFLATLCNVSCFCMTDERGVDQNH